MSPNANARPRRVDGSGKKAAAPSPAAHVDDSDKKPPAPAPAGDATVVRVSSWRPGLAVEAAVRRESVDLRLPLVGEVTLPSAPHLVWYAGVLGLAALEVVEWPVAVLMVVGKALADSHHHELLREFGDALESCT